MLLGHYFRIVVRVVFFCHEAFVVVDGWLFLLCFCCLFRVNSVDVTVMNRPNIVHVSAFTVMSRLVGFHLGLPRLSGTRHWGRTLQAC